MKTQYSTILAVAAVATLSLFTQALMTADVKDGVEAALKTAMDKEVIEGDLKGAIEQYKRIANNAAGNRSIAAKALLQMGQCYEKLGHAEARRVYERVMRDFADQQRIVAQARARLAT